MKKLAFLIIALFSAAAFADDLPKIAVYVTGNAADDEKKALGTRMLASLVNSGRYITIERSSSFLAEIEKEQEKQRSGSIDDGQISELGRQFGVKYVCIADITPAFGGFQVSARIVDVETAVVVLIGESASSLKSMDDLARVSNQIVKNMFGEQTANVRKPSSDLPPKPAGNSAPPLASDSAGQQTEYTNFTSREIFGTWGLNFLLPGVGSAAVMKDWWGTAAQWVLWGSGIVLFVNGIDTHDSTYISNGYLVTETIPEINGLFWAGCALLTSNAAYNVYRSITYKKKRVKNTAYLESAKFNIVFLPDNDGNIKGYMAYRLDF